MHTFCARLRLCDKLHKCYQSSYAPGSAAASSTQARATCAISSRPRWGSAAKRCRAAARSANSSGR